MALKTKTVSVKKAEAPLPKIGEYQLTQPWTTVEAGTSMWSFAERNGKAYHIKQHLSPVCPEADSGISVETIAKKRGICNLFYKRIRRLYDAVNSSATGNVVKIEDFFFFKTKFYTVTEKIDSIEIPAEKISRLSQEKKFLLLKVLAYSMMSLHGNGVVHADLKITNILFKKTNNYNNLVPKLIDFGDSFLVDAPNNYMVGDVYLAPESSRFIDGDDVSITQKSDIFALGLLFHEFYTGRLPDFSGEYDYAYEALLDDAALSVDTSMEPIGLASLIHGMLAVSPEARPSAEVVFQSLQELQNPVPASDAWVCANCGMKNDMHISNAKFCVQCGWPRNKPAAGTPPSEPWKCGNCGYVNLAVRRDCIKCGAVRGSKTADASADMRAFFEIPEL